MEAEMEVDAGVPQAESADKKPEKEGDSRGIRRNSEAVKKRSDTGSLRRWWLKKVEKLEQ